LANTTFGFSYRTGTQSIFALANMYTQDPCDQNPTNLGPNAIFCIPNIPWDATCPLAVDSAMVRVRDYTAFALVGRWAIVNTTKKTFRLIAHMSDGGDISLGTYAWDLQIASKGTRNALFPPRVTEGIDVEVIAPLTFPSDGPPRANFCVEPDLSYRGDYIKGTYVPGTSETACQQPTPGQCTTARLSRYRYTLVTPSFELIDQPNVYRATTNPAYCRYSRQLKPLSLPAAVSLTPTIDNVLQIVCNELEIDRTAGASSSQILAVVPFDYTQLSSNFYLIELPTNSLIWRRISNRHIKNLSFEVFNGNGDPHPALVGQDYVVNLQIRFL
jgi:hypothetical protein